MALSFSNKSTDSTSWTGTTITITGVVNSASAGFTSSGFFGFRGGSANFTPANLISATYGGVALGNAIGSTNTSSTTQPAFAVAGTNLPTGSNTLILNFTASASAISMVALFFNQAGAVTSSGASSTNGASTTRTVPLTSTSATDWYVAFIREPSGVNISSISSDVAGAGTVRSTNTDGQPYSGSSTSTIGTAGALVVTFTLTGSVNSSAVGYTFTQGTAIVTTSNNALATFGGI